MNYLFGISAVATSIFLNSPIFGLISGIVFVTIFRKPNIIISKSIGTYMLQTGIVILGFTISSSTALDLTSSFFIHISFYVIVIFVIGLLLARVLKINISLGILISSGTAICGATAIAAVSNIIKATPKDILISLGIIFFFNALAIIFLPLIGKHLEMTAYDFGAFAALAIHDTSSVIGAAMTFGDDALNSAVTLKLLRTLWLIPLVIAMGIYYGDKDTKLSLPLFVVFFAIAVFIGSLVNFQYEIIYIFNTLSKALIIGALFCIGAQFNMQTTEIINFKNLLYSLSLWIIALITSFLLIYIY
tara:strand:- start:190 stop:1098 length:909 start_codon:yes stop_codon:yes gene_type:complete